MNLTQHREHVMSEIKQAVDRRRGANEDLLWKASQYEGCAVFRRFKTPSQAQDARDVLVHARGEGLAGWALFTRGEFLYVVAPDRNGKVPEKWAPFALGGAT